MSGARLRSGKRLGKARIVEPGLKEKMTKEGSDMLAIKSWQSFVILGSFCSILLEGNKSDASEKRAGVS